MPVTYTIDKQHRLIFTRVTGVLTIAETTEYFERIMRDTDCPDEAIEIVDFSGVTDFSLRFNDMRAITLKYQRTKSAKQILATIFNCTSNLSYGIGRMLQTLHEIANEQHMVIITRTEKELSGCIEALRSKK